MWPHAELGNQIFHGSDITRGGFTFNDVNHGGDTSLNVFAFEIALHTLEVSITGHFINRRHIVSSAWFLDRRFFHTLSYSQQELAVFGDVTVTVSCSLVYRDRGTVCFHTYHCTVNFIALRVKHVGGYAYTVVAPYRQWHEDLLVNGIQTRDNLISIGQSTNDIIVLRLLADTVTFVHERSFSFGTDTHHVQECSFIHIADRVHGVNQGLINPVWLLLSFGQAFCQFRRNLLAEITNCILHEFTRLFGKRERLGRVEAKQLRHNPGSAFIRFHDTGNVICWYEFTIHFFTGYTYKVE